MLTVSHLRKDFTSVRAVDDVSFTVKPGQVFGLIGPNGAGKSTTIRMIMDIIQPDSGEILFNGKRPGESGKNLVGYLPEERGLYRKNKLVHVIAYFASLKGMDAAAARAAAAPWLERFSLTHALKRNVEELSKGNQQKVQFIISVLHRPALLVLDEVFSGLDPVNQILIKDALQELRLDNRAIIFSTHQMEFAEKLCDDLVLINKGRIVLEGSPAGIKQRFGKNSVQIEFEGEGDFLETLPGVARAQVSQNFAELVVADGADTNSILTAAVARLQIARFARIEPSLEAIFIETVGMPEAETTAAAALPPKSAAQDKRVRRELFTSLLMFLAVLVVAAAQVKAGHLQPVLFFILIGAAMLSALRFFRVKKKVQAELRERAEGGPRA
ncbi:MAG: ATP-binding cassette domain-containing protein [Ignavibacteria bacterium]|nr:ATP-binding cassette domain-containing protein [Ignavibacteria bacterium]